jgi:glucokinase
MYITIDVGGTNIRVASSDSIDQPVLKDIRKFRSQNDYRLDLDNIVQAIRELSNGERLQGIGIGTPGVISPDKTFVAVCGSLTDWVQKPLVDDLSKAFECKVILENDAATAALGEAVYGQGKGHDFIFMIWGTGVGGSMVVNIDGGIYVYPFEPGHQILNWHGPRCHCGQIGCAQLSAGGDIIEYFRKPAEELTDDEWQEVFQFFAHLMANVLIIRPTKLVIFGGGIALNQPERVEAVRRILQRRVLVAPIPEMKTTEFGDDIALYGGLSLLTGKMHVVRP